MGPVHQLARVEQPSKINKLKPTPASSTTPSSTHPPPQSQPGAGAALDVGVDLGGDGVPVRDGWPEPDGDGRVLESLDDGGHLRLRGRPPTPGPPVSTPRPLPRNRVLQHPRAILLSRPVLLVPDLLMFMQQQEGDKLSSMEKRKLSSFQQFLQDGIRLKKLLEKEASSSEPVIVSMVIEMKKKFKKYWDLSYLKICVPVVLDPRFRLGFLDFRLKKGFGNMAGAYFSKIEQTFRELFKEYSPQTIGSVCNNTKSNSKDVIIVDENDPWADWGQIQNVQQSKTIDELEQYLSEETVPVTASFNILEHWKVYASKYPTLARMARDILAIPASTVASESAFSTGERVISDYRSSLASGTVEALICLPDCLRSKESNEDNIAGNIIGGEEEEDYWQFEVEASKIKAAGR
ncbi:hypothetical protein EJB05_48801 [Eragrostis curvula]|uniref:HAT C-terminal dimerisation domain-containing protein n=1 Tax=Eragrostis curvula TaxID=38414 RepID=A0A5J9T2V5_9POAL|nr:hypothetical protein EJB05_48801 [Eragrostis curvula]